MCFRYSFFRFILLWVADFLLLSSWQVFAGTQTAVTKDATALSALTQMAIATGWSIIPTDAVATGSVTVLKGKNQGTMSFTLKMKGLTENKTELQGADGVTATVVNDSEGAVVTPSDTRFLSPYEALSIRPIALPLFSDVSNFSAANVSVSYQGDENINGSLAHRIQITRIPDANDLLHDERQREAPITVWIDVKTGLPAQISYLRFADNPTFFFTFVRQFGNWQTINGMQIPFQQSEFLGDQLMSTTTVTSVQFNVGLNDADFALPNVLAQ